MAAIEGRGSEDGQAVNSFDLDIVSGCSGAKAKIPIDLFVRGNAAFEYSAESSSGLFELGPARGSVGWSLRLLWMVLVNFGLAALAPEQAYAHSQSALFEQDSACLDGRRHSGFQI